MIKEYCKKCNQIKISRYCEKCKKETSSLFKLQICETITVNDSSRIKQKREGFKGWMRELREGFFPSKDKKQFPNGVNISRNIDRKNNQYDEIVKDCKTGGIIHECHESLSKHYGHGSASSKHKNKK